MSAGLWIGLFVGTLLSSYLRFVNFSPHTMSSLAVLVIRYLSVTEFQLGDHRIWMTFQNLFNFWLGMRAAFNNTLYLRKCLCWCGAGSALSRYAKGGDPPEWMSPSATLASVKVLLRVLHRLKCCHCCCLQLLLLFCCCYLLMLWFDCYQRH